MVARAVYLQLALLSFRLIILVLQRDHSKLISKSTSWKPFNAIQFHSKTCEISVFVLYKLSARRRPRLFQDISCSCSKYSSSFPFVCFYSAAFQHSSLKRIRLPAKTSFTTYISQPKLFSPKENFTTLLSFGHHPIHI